MADDTGQDEEPTADQLTGQLAEDLSRLLRGELELAAVRREPALRRIGVELGAALPALAAALLALAALTCAAGLGLAHLIADWASALVVAAAWGLVAIALVRLDHPRRLLARLRAEVGGAAGRVERERDEAEQALRATAERLGRAALRASVGRDLAAPLQGAEHLIGAVEHDRDDLVREAVAALLAPGRAGLGLLEALLGRHEPPPPAAPPRRRRGDRSPPG